MHILYKYLVQIFFMALFSEFANTFAYVALIEKKNFLESGCWKTVDEISAMRRDNMLLNTNLFALIKSSIVSS